MQKVIVKSKMRIAKVLEDGFECEPLGKQGFIRKGYYIRDNLLRGIESRQGKVISITLENVSEDIIKLSKERVLDNYCIFFVVAYDVFDNGFYTKEYDDNDNIFSRTFFYKGRGLITLPELKESNRFEPGDCIKVTVRGF